MASITAWHDKTVDEHVELRDKALRKGYRFISLSIHGSTFSPRYSAVMMKRPVVVAQRDWPLLSADQFQKVFDEQAKQGYGPVLVAATGSTADPRYAVVFEPRSPVAQVRAGMRACEERVLEPA